MKSAKKKKVNNLNKDEMYEAMQRNSYYLPAYGSTIVNKTWLNDILESNEWCPKYE
jgi:hypothetical protein